MDVDLNSNWVGVSARVLAKMAPRESVGRWGMLCEAGHAKRASVVGSDLPALEEGVCFPTIE